MCLFVLSDGGFLGFFLHLSTLLLAIYVRSMLYIIIIYISMYMYMYKYIPQSIKFNMQYAAKKERRQVNEKSFNLKEGI